LQDAWSAERIPINQRVNVTDVEHVLFELTERKQFEADMKAAERR